MGRLSALVLKRYSGKGPYDRRKATPQVFWYLYTAELKRAELFTQARDGRIRSLLIAAKLSQLLLSDDSILT